MVMNANAGGQGSIAPVKAGMPQQAMPAQGMPTQVAPPGFDPRLVMPTSASVGQALTGPLQSRVNLGAPQGMGSVAPWVPQNFQGNLQQYIQPPIYTPWTGQGYEGQQPAIGGLPGNPQNIQPIVPAPPPMYNDSGDGMGGGGGFASNDGGYTGDGNDYAGETGFGGWGMGPGDGLGEGVGSNGMGDGGGFY